MKNRTVVEKVGSSAGCRYMVGCHRQATDTGTVRKLNHMEAQVDSIVVWFVWLVG